MKYQRKDSLGRGLRKGECQRKDGRYMFTYTRNGEKRVVYSWMLEPEDPIPSGKQADRSLREKEALIREELADSLDQMKRDMKTEALVRRYLSQKGGLSYNTRSTYRSLLKVIEEGRLGSQRIDCIRVSDAKMWFVELQEEGRSYSMIKMIKAILQPAFDMAVEDDVLKKNPFAFKMNNLLMDDRKKRIALSEEQEQTFLDFVREDDYYHIYYPAVYILFHTGMRISEFTGLTLEDIDFGGRTVKVDHQLIRASGEFHVTTTKSQSGVRILPMTRGVHQCFHQLVEERLNLMEEPVIDGVSGFLLVSKDGKLRSNAFWKMLFSRMTMKYNRTHLDRLPSITPHICRHTYCTAMARSGMNPKVLQYLMGHANIAVTLDVYTHLRYEDAWAELRRIGIVEGEKDEYHEV